MARDNKSLLNKTSKPKKKQDKYSEISSIKKEYRFDVQDKAIYAGALDKYRGLECIITKRSRRKTLDYYNIKFNEDEELTAVADGFLRTLEEYELEMEQLKNKSENDKKDMSEFELELIKNGLESYHNYVQCLSPVTIYEMQCNECGFEDRCVYEDKYNYQKFRNL